MMQKAKGKNNIKILIDAFKFVHKNDKTIFLVSFFNALISTVKTFIMIFIPAKIILVLTVYNSNKISFLVFFALIATAGVLILSVLQKYLSELFLFKQKKIMQVEVNRLNYKVLNVKYSYLEDAKYENTLSKYKENPVSPFAQLIYVTQSIMTGVLGLIMSIILVYPLIEVIFKGGGSGFVNSPLFSVYLFCGVAVSSIIFFVISVAVNKKIYFYTDKFFQINRLHSYYVEILNDYKSGKDIRVYSAQKIINDSATRNLLTEGTMIRAKVVSIEAKKNMLIAIIGAIVGFGYYAIIGIKGLSGQIAVDSVVQSLGGMIQIISAIGLLSVSLGSYNSVIARYKEYNELLSAPEEQVGLLRSENATSFEFASIEFKDVSFKYDDLLPNALENINITINKFDKIAIVGENGSGKTTFIKLLCALYSPSKGSIFLNGKQLDEQALEEWRSLCSVVFQDFKIFSLPLAENVATGSNYDTNKLFKILSKVGMTERVQSMPYKEKTCLFKNYEKEGIEISGGEAQKVSLARALYKDAPLMVLDEPTAALDTKAEQHIYKQFNELTLNKTVLYISHRLSSCYFCNKIMVFDKGKVIQFGSHEELMKDINGKYYKLWSTQAQYYVN